MNEVQSGSSNLLDTTDCLEAVGVFKGWKNFFFVIIVICILLLQASFWLVDLGMIEAPKVPEASAGGLKIYRYPILAPNVEAQEQEQEIITEPEAPVESEVPDESTDIDESDQAVDPNQSVVSAQPILLSSTTMVEETDIVEETEQAEETESADKPFLFGITFDHLNWVIIFANAILILTATLYCLTMIFSLKVSMLGRLGGINHMTRAFFLSLLMLILVLPWQKVFSGYILGAIFAPEELVYWYAGKTSEMMDMILYYFRFCGYMVLVFLLLLMAQIRSCRWAKAILRRLEII